MNRELLAVRPDTPVSEVRELFRSFAVTAVPVVDDARRPLGMLSLRDLFEAEGAASAWMSKPAACVVTSTTIDAAARQLASTEMHHLVVVDGAGVAAGMLSTIDLLRALLEMPVRHPSAFPHWDDATQVSWTDDWPLDEEGCRHAPDVAGCLVVVMGQAGKRDAVLWTEACGNVRVRVLELVSKPSARPPSLARRFDRPGLRFRAAAVVDDAARERLAALLRDRLDHVPPVGAT